MKPAVAEELHGLSVSMGDVQRYQAIPYCARSTSLACCEAYRDTEGEIGMVARCRQRTSSVTLRKKSEIDKASVAAGSLHRKKIWGKRSSSFVNGAVGDEYPRRWEPAGICQGHVVSVESSKP